MPTDLAQLIADVREEAQILGSNRASFSVERVDQILRDVEGAAEDFLLWLSETDAAVRCGYSTGWLRARFPGWQRDGHARFVGKARQYRAVIIPRRANTISAAARGKEAAQAARKSA